MTSTPNMVGAADPAEAEMTLLFPAPVLRYDWPDSEALNGRLRELILAKRDRSPGTLRSNRGGWQSEPDVARWPEPEVAALMERIHLLMAEYVARQVGRRDERLETGWGCDAWANVNEKGHLNRVHNHIGPQSHFSGCYYVDVGDIGVDASAKGRIVFEDWTRLAIDVLDDPDEHRRDVAVTPKSGTMMLFPSYLMHSVEAYEGSSPRITIAFNFAHRHFRLPHFEVKKRESPGLRRKVPEKLLALKLASELLLSRKLPSPLSASGLRAHLRSTFSHAQLLATERFGGKGKG
jgi:uncharacterized protein (TIGR02466 family)